MRIIGTTITLLLAIAPAAGAARTALETDRELAKAVQSEGQWTAFRRFAAPGAIIFERGAHAASTHLRGRPDPRPPLTWTVHESVTSCDGTTTITVGPVQREAGKTGILLLVWRKQPDGSWKWVVWRGAAGTVSKPGLSAGALKASCTGTPPLIMRRRSEGPSGLVTSPDRTLLWYWETNRAGAVTYYTQAWNGTAYKTAAGGDNVPTLRK